ncbi:MAG: MBL fold metallo-hydrolase [Desulfurococcales archaeon]|nr:MBL fold metallo-hydrolase [Desulfurococcales archaeon]MCE4629857.1 MBL fold metallo-hydrolase [Desulfurococcales archaeon]
MSLGFKLTRHSRLILYPGLATAIDAVSVLVVSSGEAVLIDSGSGLEESLEAIALSLASLGYPDELSVKLVVNTHGHIMNAGGDWWAHDVLKATIAARPPDSKWIESGDPERTGASELGLSFRGTPVGLVITRESVKIPVGDVTIEVFHTPGHTPGSQSVYLEDDLRLVVIGDSLASLSAKWGSSEEDWWRSLEKIKERDPEVVCDSIRCYIKEAARNYLELVEREGPSRLEED